MHQKFGTLTFYFTGQTRFGPNRVAAGIQRNGGDVFGEKVEEKFMVYGPNNMAPHLL